MAVWIKADGSCVGASTKDAVGGVRDEESGTIWDDVKKMDCMHVCEDFLFCFV